MGMMGQGILEAGANIGRTLQGGYESMGKGLASGINAAASAYKEYKDDQAKFDATKKLFGAFEGYLPKQKDPVTGKEFSPMGDQIRAIFNDTTMSVREKNQMAPMLLSFLGNAQQQAGRESVANIMNAGRVEAAEARRPAPITGGVVGQVSTVDQILDAPVGQPQVSNNNSDLPRNPSQGDPSGLTGKRTSLNQMPPTRANPQTGVPQFWDPVNKRYIDEELYFDPKTLAIGD
jgi:hypothetical protein